MPPPGKQLHGQESHEPASADEADHLGGSPERGSNLERDAPAPLGVWHGAGLALLLLMAAGLVQHNLDRYPTTWFDEGWWLQIPRNLVLYGRYATLSGDEFRPTDTVVAISPAFFLPVAAAFKVFGVGLIQARMVIAVQFVIAGALLFAVTRRLYGPLSGLLALALFIFVRPDDDWTAPLLYGRQMMAEVPALMWWLAGMLAWLRWRDTGRRRLAALAGVCLATCMAVKPQFGVVLAPTLAIIWATEWRRRALAPRPAWVMPAAMVTTAVAHVAALLALLGPSDFGRLLAGFADASGPQVRTFLQPVVLRRVVSLAARSEFTLLLLPAVVLAVWRMPSGREVDFRRGVPALFVGIWLGWFATATPGWSRYALPAVAIGLIPIAGLVTTVFAGPLRRARAAARTRHFSAAAPGVAAIVFAAVLVLRQAPTMLENIFLPPPPDAQRFATFVSANVPPDVPVNTWEWSIAFLASDRRFVLPPTRALTSVIARNEFGEPWTIPPYDITSQPPPYIAVGWFSRWSGLYPRHLLEERFELAFRAGDYELYRLVR